MPTNSRWDLIQRLTG